MAIPQLTTDAGEGPLDRKYWIPDVWRRWAAKKTELPKYDRDDIQRLVITIQTREAELTEAEERIERLIRERDEAANARARMASDNRALQRRLADTQVGLDRHKRSAADREYMQAKYDDVAQLFVTTKPAPTWTMISRSTTETTQADGSKVRTVVTEELAR